MEWSDLMSNTKEGTNAVAGSQEAQGSQAANLQTHGDKVAAARASSSETSFSSVEELRKKEPKLYQMILEGQFVSFMRRQERANERRENLRKEYERDN